MLDQFAQHESNVLTESAAVSAAFGSNWVIARRTPRIIERYGAGVRCISVTTLARVEALHHRDNGCPPRCPARVRSGV